MYKLTLLLIPLILLSSCTIDWNDEKNTKITQLETQIARLNQPNPTPVKPSICYLRSNESADTSTGMLSEKTKGCNPHDIILDLSA
jgi:hypothetical protein